MPSAAAVLALAGPLVLAAAPAVAAGDLGAVLYERTLMREAGARCKLFAPPVQAGLAAGAAQARGAAVREGADPRALDAAAARASARAAREPCASPDLRVAAQRVRAAFLGWSRQNVLELPGPAGGWTARRRADRPVPFWALSTRTRLGGAPAVLGLRRASTASTPVFALETPAPDAARAWTARLAMRDPARAPQPYLAADGGPPAAALIETPASGKLALDGGRAWRFTFPGRAAEALAALDPREHVRVELVLPGDRTVSTLVEAGDFATGRAFLAAGP